MRGIHRSPVKGQRRGALMFSLICARINELVNNDEAGDFRRHRAHYEVIVNDISKLCITGHFRWERSGDGRISLTEGPSNFIGTTTQVRLSNRQWLKLKFNSLATRPKQGNSRQEPWAHSLESPVWGRNPRYNLPCVPITHIWRWFVTQCDTDPRSWWFRYTVYIFSKQTGYRMCKRVHNNKSVDTVIKVAWLFNI